MKWPDVLMMEKKYKYPLKPQTRTTVGQMKDELLKKKSDNSISPIKVNVKVNDPVRVRDVHTVEQMSTFFWGIRRSENIIASERKGEGVTKAYRRFK